MLTARTTHAKASVSHLSKIVELHKIDVAAVRRLVDESTSTPTVNRELFPPDDLEEEFKPLRTSPREESTGFIPIRRRARSSTESNIENAPRFARTCVDLHAYETLDTNADYWGSINIPGLLRGPTAFTPFKHGNKRQPMAPYAPIKKRKLCKSPVDRVKDDHKHPTGETPFIRSVSRLPLVEIPLGDTYYKAICRTQLKKVVAEKNATPSLIAVKTIEKSDFLTCTPSIGTVFFTGKRDFGDETIGRKPVRLMCVVIDVVDKIISCMYITTESNGRVKAIQLAHGINLDTHLTVRKFTLNQLWDHIGSTSYYMNQGKSSSCTVHIAGVICTPTWIWRSARDHADRLTMDSDVRHIWRSLPKGTSAMKKKHFIDGCVEKKLLTSDGKRILTSINKEHFAQAKFVEYLVTFNEWGM
jgi:hypothetical protein